MAQFPFAGGKYPLAKYERSRAAISNDEGEFRTCRPVTRIMEKTPLSLQRRYLSTLCVAQI
jgi:hypothetical protein